MPLDSQYRHSLGFAEAWRRYDGCSATADAEQPSSVLDLGSGGGLPGLVVATVWTRAKVVLLDSALRRVEFLRRAIVLCELSERVTAVRDRAETIGRESQHRARYAVVVARSFGPPGVTAECAAPLLMEGGVAIISEPPDGSVGDRWPSGPLAELGMVALGPVRVGAAGYQILRQDHRVGDRYPRRIGIPSKRPLF